MLTCSEIARPFRRGQTIQCGGAGIRSEARLLIKANGGRYVTAGKATSLEREPPKSRVVVLVFDSMEKIQAWRNSAEFKEHRKISDKYAKFRSYAIEGSHAIIPMCHLLIGRGER